MNRILLADDHEIMRTGLKVFINSVIGFAVIDEAWDGDSVIKKVKQHDYQLIILDVNMPATDAFGLISNILAIKPDEKILMFSMNPEDLYAKRYLQLGAKGYISKISPESDIKVALDNVLKGKKYVSPALQPTFDMDVTGKNLNNPFENLSPREFEIVLHLIRGASLAEIGQALHLQTSTVGTHKARIFEKLHCSNIIDIKELAKVYNVIPSA